MTAQPPFKLTAKERKLLNDIAFDEGKATRLAAGRLTEPLLARGLVPSARLGYSRMDYATMQRGSLRLLPLDHQLDAWRQDYAAMRGEMFFGPTAEFDVVLKAVGEFARIFNEAPPA